MRSLTLAREDIARLLSDRFLRIALVAVALVPLLYGGIYLAAFWNPNGHIDRIPVALVNADRPVRVDGERLSAGEDLVRELRRRRTFDWHVVSEEQARAGVRDRRYYLSLTIPREFSATLATADSSNPHRATLLLTQHESASMLASQIGDRVIAELRAATSASISRGYYDRILVGFGQVGSSLTDAGAGARTLARGIAHAKVGASALAAGTSDARDGATVLADGAHTLADGSGAVNDGAHDLAAGATKLSRGMLSAEAGSRKLATGASSTAEGADALSSGTTKLAAGAQRLSDASRTLAAGAGDLDVGIAQGASGLSSAAQGAAGVSDGAASTVAALEALGQAHPELASDAGYLRALGAAKQTSGGAGQLSAGLAASVSRLGALVSGAHALAQGSADLSDAASSLAAGADDAASGASRLASATGSLAAGSASLARGIGSADDGARALASGAADLAVGTGKASGGAHDLAAGATRLSVGLARLDDGGERLSSGLSSAVGGSRELASGLTAGADDIPSLTTAERDANARMMSDPVELTTSRLGAVPNYGTGFAPYFIPLSLWVGAMIMFFVIQPVPPRALQGRVPSWIAALAGYWPAALLGVAQSVLLLSALRFGLGLRMQSVAMTIGFTLLAGLAFVAILQWLCATFGLAGRFLAIVALMLQLTSSAGTYPLETLPRFFRAISPLLPMTYVVSGLREAISGGNWSVVGHDSLIIVAFGVVALVLSAVSVRLRRAGRLRLASIEV